jgi:hypothetical protein
MRTVEATLLENRAVQGTGKSNTLLARESTFIKHILGVLEAFTSSSPSTALFVFINTLSGRSSGNNDRAVQRSSLSSALVARKSAFIEHILGVFLAFASLGPSAALGVLISTSLDSSDLSNRAVQGLGGTSTLLAGKPARLKHVLGVLFAFASLGPCTTLFVSV